MRRQQLWQALSDAAHAVMTATEDWKEDPTPAKRAVVDGAVARYVDYLAPVIGSEAAFRFEATTRAFNDAVDRFASLIATLQGRVLDAADVQLLQGVAAEQVAAGRAYVASQSALLAALNKAHLLDEQGDQQ